MQHDIRKYLVDIQNSISSIDEYLGLQHDFKVYVADKMLRRAVERELEIIGEAVGKILQLDPDISIDNARKITDMRNRVIHAYDSVSNEIVWSVVVNHLPKLAKDVAKLLK